MINALALDKSVYPSKKILTSTQKHLWILTCITHKGWLQWMLHCMSSWRNKKNLNTLWLKETNILSELWIKIAKEKVPCPITGNVQIQSLCSSVHAFQSLNILLYGHHMLQIPSLWNVQARIRLHIPIWAQLFKANDIISLRFVKIYIKWYANMLKLFAEKMWVAFAVQKLLTFFQQKISEYCVLNPVKQLTKWPLTSLLS